MSSNNIDLLKENLQQGIVKICFEKKDGTLREMLATLSPTIVPPTTKTTDETKTKSDKVLAVFDTEVGAWRSFIVENLKSFEVLGV